MRRPGTFSISAAANHPRDRRKGNSRRSPVADYIPKPDAQAADWMFNNASYVSANAAALGVGTSRATLYTDLVDTFRSSLDAHLVAQDAARAATLSKDDARAAAQSAAREIAQIIQTNPAVTDQQRASAGLPVHDDSRTPVPPPTAVPVFTVDTGERWKHTIRIGFGEGVSRAKPAGVRGYEVYSLVGSATPPADLSACNYVMTATKGSFTIPYTGTDLGKMAWYIIRCVNTTGERGPVSETVGATIAA
jgi:hypothetical protein